MSWKVQALVSERLCGGMSRKMVLINMAARANDDGTGVYASLPTMAAWCEVDARTIRRVVRSIESDGLARIVGRRKCNNGFVHEWAMNLEAIAALPAVKDEVDERRRAKAATRTPDTESTADIKSARTLCPVTPDIMPGLGRTLCPPNLSIEPISTELRSVGRAPRAHPEKQASHRNEAKGSRLPDDWTLTPQLIAYAVEHGFSEHEARFVGHRFENYWRAVTGAKARKRDWTRTWQNWVTNEDRRKVREGAAAWKSSPAKRAPIGEWAARERAPFERGYRDNGAWPSWGGPKPDEPGYGAPLAAQADNERGELPFGIAKARP